MVVNFIDFENNLRKYCNTAKKEEIVITENNKAIFKIIPLKNEEAPITKSLVGALKKCNEIDLSITKEERLKKYEDIN